MTSSGVNREACRGLIQREGASPPFSPTPSDSLLSFITASSSSPTPCNRPCLAASASLLSEALSGSRGGTAEALAGRGETGPRGQLVNPVRLHLQSLFFRKDPPLASQREASRCSRCSKQVLSSCSQLETSLCDCLPFEEFQSNIWRVVLTINKGKKTSHLK